MKTALIIVIGIGLVLAVLILKQKPTIAPDTTEMPMTSANTTPTVSIMPSSQTVIITFTNGTATPNTINIKVGDTIKFINDNSIPHWPASGMHPTHQICPGFDALHGINNGESYSFTFNEAKTCPWHDHLKPSVNGQIVINP
ncbi:MAG: hypothetical protein HYT61_02360 [Candidatus Yanofskybacteria bacterium]|nr:hypothetical protein [Candidatus Yanofskybacteria bacterium]